MKLLTRYRETLRSPLARQFIVAIVLFSSAATLALTTLQLYAEYHHEVDELEKSLQQMEKVHLKSLTQSLWATNVKELTLQLEGLARVPDIEYVAVHEGERLWAQAGERISTHFLERHYPMVYIRAGKLREIGMLTVVASLDHVYRHILTRATVILLSNALKTFLVAGFIFAFFHWLVNRHLRTIAAHVRGLEHADTIVPLQLARAPRSAPDELDEVASAINLTHERTRAALTFLREREQQLVLITDNLPGLVARVDRDLRYLFVNAQYERWFGLSPAAIVGRRIPEVIDAETFARFEPFIKRALAGERVSFECMIKIASGQVVYIQATYVPDVGPDATVQGLFILATDVTERKRARDESRRNEERLQLATRASNDVIWDWDLLNSTLWWNQNFTQLFGYPPEEIEPGIESWTNRLHPDDKDRVVAGVHAVLDHGGQSWKDEYRFRCCDGSYVHVFDRGYVIRDGQAKPVRMVGAMVDVTERTQAVEQSRKLSGAIEQTADSVIITDREGVIEYVNPAFEAITGFTSTEALGRNPNIIKSGEHDAAFYSDLWNTVLRGEVFRATFINRRKDGVLYHEEKTITPLRDVNGVIIHFVSTGKDITERVHIEKQLSYLAYHDELTGLPNRALFYDRLQQAMTDAERHERLLAVVFVDLDRFKNINDTLGHDAGDQLLKGVTERLLGAVRRGDTVARLSGDEFTIALADMAHVDDAARVAQKILDVFTQPFHIAGRDLFVGASLGITMFPFDTRDAGELLRNADIAMYRAKEAGRNTYQFYTAEMTAKATEAMVLESELRHGLERGEFLLHYQPIVDSGGNILGAEALLRWQHGQRGLVSPAQFIPLAEETGLILPIGDWVLRQACAQAHAWRGSGDASFRISVNVSPRQFRHRGLAQTVETILKETGLDPKALDIEITESVLMQQETLTQELFSWLSDHGVSFSIDDFGTGYSSLSYLKRFKIDHLKIDQSFIRFVTTDPDDSALVTAIISMAHSLGIQTVAEGVETRGQRAFLLKHGCDAMQGYYFSRPVPAEAFTALLTTGKPLLGNGS